jgi:hypothetical protein
LSGGTGIFSEALYPLKQHSPGSLTRKLYRKKIPEIVKIVNIVPKAVNDETREGGVMPELQASLS